MKGAVYIASPLGFAESTRGYSHLVVEAVRSIGWEPLDPWDDEGGAFAMALLAAQGEPDPAERKRLLAELDMGAGRRNQQLLDRADAVLAVLDGVDVDSGTAAEVGYARGRGLTVIGLRTDLRRSGENEGCTVNLQVEYFINSSGGRVVATLAEAVSLLGVLRA